METVNIDAPMNARTCASWLGKSPRTVIRLAKNNLLPGRKVAGSWFFLKSELVEFLKGKEVK